jgi:glycyl-tRNA synthetase
VADALRDLAERDPSAFDGDEVTVEVDGETVIVDGDVANFRIEEQTEAGEHVTPHVVEPSFGVDRTVYTLIAHAYDSDVIDGEERTYLSLAPEVTPTDVAVFPLVSDDALETLADDVVADLRGAGLSVAHDDSGNIGRRYRRQDEVGTPLSVTVDHESVEGETETVTVRDRDTTTQVRVPTAALPTELGAILDGRASFSDLLDRYERVDTDVTRS